MSAITLATTQTQAAVGLSGISNKTTTSATINALEGNSGTAFQIRITADIPTDAHYDNLAANGFDFAVVDNQIQITDLVTSSTWYGQRDASVIQPNYI